MTDVLFCIVVVASPFRVQLFIIDNLDFSWSVQLVILQLFLFNGWDGVRKEPIFLLPSHFGVDDWSLVRMDNTAWQIGPNSKFIRLSNVVGFLKPLLAVSTLVRAASPLILKAWQVWSDLHFVRMWLHVAKSGGTCSGEYVRFCAQPSLYAHCHSEELYYTFFLLCFFHIDLHVWFTLYRVQVIAR